ncbi:uncharacterized protein METZ01_LOCUS103689, partial [marine metagenome]
MQSVKPPVEVVVGWADDPSKTLVGTDYRIRIGWHEARVEL